jgi:DNA-binding NarL/FixJ family response regulator
MVTKIKFTEWELKILELMAQGFKPLKISRALDISPAVCGNHIDRILKKLGARNPIEAVYFAARDSYI